VQIPVYADGILAQHWNVKSDAGAQASTGGTRPSSVFLVPAGHHDRVSQGVNTSQFVVVVTGLSEYASVVCPREVSGESTINIS
jgi:hypothetical protein